MEVDSTLEWKQEAKYYKNALCQWSPWLSTVGIQIENETWIEIARCLNNK